MRKLYLLDSPYILGLILVFTLSASLVQAGTIIQCGAELCSSDFNIMFNGTDAGGGELIYDAETGDIVLNTDPGSITGNNVMAQEDGSVVWTMGDGSTVSVDELFGNADPILGFGVGASTAGAGGSTFSFTFNLPIALQGTIFANSSVSYSLSSLSEEGAQVAPVGGSNIVTALEVDTDVGGKGSLNKGVDVGSTFFFNGGPDTQNSSTFTASNSFTGDLAYDLMTVKVDFSLSADSTVAISGFVQQVVVPIPAAVWLFGSGLLGLVGIARRKKA
jgi:hypothetical protein